MGLVLQLLFLSAISMHVCFLVLLRVKIGGDDGSNQKYTTTYWAPKSQLTSAMMVTMGNRSIVVEGSRALAKCKR